METDEVLLRPAENGVSGHRNTGLGPLQAESSIKQRWPGTMGSSTWQGRTANFKFVLTRWRGGSTIVSATGDEYHTARTQNMSPQWQCVTMTAI
jgi:hypothetical protein